MLNSVFGAFMFRAFATVFFMTIVPFWFGAKTLGISEWLGLVPWAITVFLVWRYLAKRSVVKEAKLASLAAGREPTGLHALSQAGQGTRCGNCAKGLSPVWRGSCQHCGASYAYFAPVPASGRS